MLNIVYAGSLAVSAAFFPVEPIHSLENLTPSPRVEIVNESRLAEGRRYESDYRNEADRVRENSGDTERNRYDSYEVEYDRDGRGRIHRDAEQRRREENLESEQPRYRPEDRYRDRHRDRDRDRSIYYWRQ